MIMMKTRTTMLLHVQVCSLLQEESANASQKFCFGVVTIHEYVHNVLKDFELKCLWLDCGPCVVNRCIEHKAKSRVEGSV